LVDEEPGLDEVPAGLVGAAFVGVDVWCASGRGVAFDVHRRYAFEVLPVAQAGHRAAGPAHRLDQFLIRHIVQGCSGGRVVHGGAGREDLVPLSQYVVVAVLVEVLAEPVTGDQVLDLDAIEQVLESLFDRRLHGRRVCCCHDFDATSTLPIWAVLTKKWV
jgi:hypothetical protein